MKNCSLLILVCVLVSIVSCSPKGVKIVEDGTYIAAIKESIIIDDKGQEFLRKLDCFELTTWQI